MKIGRGILALSLLFALTAVARASTYQVETYPTLCDAVYDEANYTTEFLRKHWRILPGQGNWLANSSMDFPDYGNIISAQGQQELSRLTQVLANFDTQLMLVYIPARGVAYPELLNAQQAGYDAALARKQYATALENFRAQGINVPDLTSLFAYDAPTPMFYEKDIHWSISGAQRTAQLVAQQLDGLGLAEINAPAKYETVYNGVMLDVANVEKAIEEICGFKFAPSYSATYTTNELASDTELDSFSLFDTVADEITLLGTSFSALSKFNFVGYVQEYANVPVTNYALSGGGLIGSWINYLKSGDFHAQPPRLIIWEVPGWRDFEPRFFHTILPLFFDTCGPDDVAMQASKLTVNANQRYPNAVFDPKGSVKPARELMLQIETDSPHIEELQLRLWFANGGSRLYKLRHQYRTPNDGQFQTLLGENHNYPLQPVVGIDIENTKFYSSGGEQPSASVDVKLCSNPLPYE
ncbi:alginate O-acetyltransferase AlgX-related protein [Alteromonas flava]|uniref:alginate O-acetyltransferase AlgX-related protein n=1 Tax=Alteromonas flava TaxID=2048003 RepID=UPI000C2917C7|nr:hypothetical protein [Alteromonas flava]